METEFRSKGWDELLENDKNRWQNPNEHAPILVNGLRKNFSGQIRALDIGYGAGRHLLYFHEQGFKVSGFDIALNAEDYAREKLDGVKGAELIDLKTFDMLSIPYPYNSNSFEGVLAINVIHHTNYQGFLRIISEISRVLVPSGLFLATIASKNNHKFGKGPKIDDYAYLTDIGAEKGVPHAFFDEKDLIRIFGASYKIKELRLISGEIPEADKAMKKEGALDHWLVYVEKK